MSAPSYPVANADVIDAVYEALQAELDWHWEADGHAPGGEAVTYDLARVAVTTAAQKHREMVMAGYRCSCIQWWEGRAKTPFLCRHGGGSLQLTAGLATFRVHPALTDPSLGPANPPPQGR